jgi:hypothetical protein
MASGLSMGTTSFSTDQTSYEHSNTHSNDPEKETNWNPASWIGNIDLLYLTVWVAQPDRSGRHPTQP